MSVQGGRNRRALLRWGCAHGRCAKDEAGAGRARCGMGSVGPRAPAASHPRVPIGDVGQSADPFLTPVLDVAPTKPHRHALFGVWRSSRGARAPRGDCSRCTHRSLVFLPDFYRTNFAALRNHLLSGRDNIYIPHEGFWTNFCFWLHVSVPSPPRLQCCCNE